MRTTTIHCNRCRCTITGGHSILEVKAGDLANRIEEPYFDLCAGCIDRFLDWLRSGRQNGQHAAVAAPAVESAVTAGWLASGKLPLN
jgi:hypothetical protein